MQKLEVSFSSMMLIEKVSKKFEQLQGQGSGLPKQDQVLNISFSCLWNKKDWIDFKLQIESQSTCKLNTKNIGDFLWQM